MSWLIDISKSFKMELKLTGIVNKVLISFMTMSFNLSLKNRIQSSQRIHSKSKNLNTRYFVKSKYLESIKYIIFVFWNHETNVIVFWSILTISKLHWLCDFSCFICCNQFEFADMKNTLVRKMLWWFSKNINTVNWSYVFVYLSLKINIQYVKNTTNSS